MPEGVAGQRGDDTPTLTDSWADRLRVLVTPVVLAGFPIWLMLTAIFAVSLGPLIGLDGEQLLLAPEEQTWLRLSVAAPAAAAAVVALFAVGGLFWLGASVWSTGRDAVAARSTLPQPSTPTGQGADVIRVRLRTEGDAPVQVSADAEVAPVALEEPAQAAPRKEVSQPASEPAGDDDGDGVDRLFS